MIAVTIRWILRATVSTCQNALQISVSVVIPYHERILDNYFRDIDQICCESSWVFQELGNYWHKRSCLVFHANTCMQHRLLYIAFLDFENAFHRRTPPHLVFIAIIPSIRALHQIALPRSDEFEVLQEYQNRFVLCRSSVTQDIQLPSSFTLYYADDVFLVSQNKPHGSTGNLV